MRSSDIVDRQYPGTEVQDFLSLPAEPKQSCDIITNPPYKFAKEFAEHSIDIIEDGHKIAMFLKLTFLEGQGRQELFKKYPPKYVYVFPNRMKCAKNGDFESAPSSAVAYAWFVWEKGFEGDPAVKWIN